MLENSRGEQCGLKAMNCSRANDATESAHRKARRFGVIRKIVQPTLNCSRRVQVTNKASLARREFKLRRLYPLCIRQVI